MPDELNERPRPLDPAEIPAVPLADEPLMIPGLISDPPVRNELRRFLAPLLIVAATAMSLGQTLRTPSMLEANDISRWCTVWALLEGHGYVIDECPWQHRTQDQVIRPDKLPEPAADASLLSKLEYRLAPARWKGGEPTYHHYSSKPALLPTLIAGLLYPGRVLSGVPLETVRSEPRNPVNRQEPVEGEPGVFRTRTIPAEERGLVEWPAHIYYFKPIIVLFNVVPFFAMLILYARFLDRHAPNDWAWAFGLAAAGFGTYLFAFNVTLNNHTVAAYSAFFAIYATIRIVADGRRHWGYFLASGFFAAFSAASELPAVLFLVLLFLILLVIAPKKTLLAFLPAALVPSIALLWTQLMAFGQFAPVYLEYKTESYQHEGSYWQTPLEFDYFNDHPEPKGVYIFHMLIGHHGFFSLTPIFLFALVAVLANLFGKRRRLSHVAWLTLILTSSLVYLYGWVSQSARNYGGSTQGLRWFFWLIPFWLVMLPMGVSAGGRHRWVRVLALLALAVSIFSVGFALRTPWSHPWIVELIERLGYYHLER